VLVCCGRYLTVLCAVSSKPGSRDALRFEELYARLSSRPILKKKWSILYLLHSLSGQGIAAKACVGFALPVLKFAGFVCTRVATVASPRSSLGRWAWVWVDSHP
jgi:hypothetical protein